MQRADAASPETVVYMRTKLIVSCVLAACVGMSIVFALPSRSAPDQVDGAGTILSSTEPTFDTGGAKIRLDVEPLEIDLAEYLEGEDSDNGAVGIPWTSTPGANPADLLVNDVQQDLFDVVLSCFPADSSASEMYSMKLKCFDPAVIDAAANTPDPTDVFVAINALSVARPDVFTLCHNASHRVGEIALRRVVGKYGFDVDILTQLLDEGGSACMGGLMHGVLDTVGYSATNISEFEAAVQACLRANPDTIAYCADGVGHAAWDGFESLEVAPLACAFFPEPRQRQWCGEGIVMRLYQRLEVVDEWYTGRIENAADLDRWNDEVSSLCDDWPSEPYATAPEDPREWCWTGGVYLLAKPIIAAVQIEGNNYEAAADEVSRRWDRVVEVCTDFVEPGSSMCLLRLAGFAGIVSGFEKEPAFRLCERFPDSEIESCKLEAADHIDVAVG